MRYEMKGMRGLAITLETAVLMVVGLACGVGETPDLTGKNTPDDTPAGSVPSAVQTQTGPTGSVAPVQTGMMVPRAGSVEELVSRSRVIVVGAIGPDPVEKLIGPYSEDGKPLPAGEEGGNPFTDYVVQIEDVLKADYSIAASDTFVLRMFGHMSNRDAVITPNVFTLPNPGDRLLFALGRNPDGTYGSGPEGLLDVGGETVTFADGAAFGAQVSPEQLIQDIKDAATDSTAKKDDEQSIEVRVECEVTVELALENPMLVARGVDPIPSGIDAVNGGGCSFEEPISAVTLELHRGGNKVFSQKIILDPAVSEVPFPLSGAVIDAIPAYLDLGSYDRIIKVTTVDGLVKEVRSDAGLVWLLDPASSPKAEARLALIAARRALVDSLAIQYAGPALITFEPVEWNDGGLGCPKPGMMYAQVITPGFKLVFEYLGRQYEYHTVQDGSTVVECEIASASTSTPDSGSAPDDTSQKIAQSRAVREISPDVSQASLSQLTAANTVFAFDLYQALREDDGNLFFSPFSISAALAMTYAGARNETEAQMAATLHYTQPQERLHPAFNAIDRELNDPGVGPGGDDFQLRVANSLWGQIDYEIKAEFLDLIARNYGAGLRLVDFIDPVSREQARLAINQWASDQTEGKIEDLVPVNILSDMTRLVLANAIYFNAKWDRPFLSGTKDDEFILLGGDRVNVPMMSRRARTNYVQGEGYQAVELAYKGGGAQMIVLLPDEGRFEDIEASLGQELMEEVLQGFASTDVKLFMPKFEYEADLRLADTLSAMGMPHAFDPGQADFTGIVVNPNPTLYIKDVLHKAFVAVDEIGTEAAAATAVVMEIESMPTVVKIDRPFIFIIRENKYDTILFVGRVLNPTA